MSGRTSSLFLLCAAFALGACAIVPPSPPRPVRHVVLLWLKNPERALDRAQLIRAARSLQLMPGVTRVTTGRSLPPGSPAVERTFNLAVVIDFRDRSALERYQRDPNQTAALERYLRPLVRRFESFDLNR